MYVLSKLTFLKSFETEVAGYQSTKMAPLRILIWPGRVRASFNITDVFAFFVLHIKEELTFWVGEKRSPVLCCMKKELMNCSPTERETQILERGESSHNSSMIVLPLYFLFCFCFMKNNCRRIKSVLVMERLLNPSPSLEHDSVWRDAFEHKIWRKKGLCTPHYGLFSAPNFSFP